MNDEKINGNKELDLPEPPKLEIYMETFGGLIDVTDQWYKENED